MKTNIILLVSLVTMVTQTYGQYQKDDVNVQFYLTVEVNVLEYKIENITPNFTSDWLMTNVLPKYLNTFSLTGLFDMINEEQQLQERFNLLLATNDPMFPKEYTLFDWLAPVRYQQYKFGGAENMPEGFGPRIIFYS